MKKQNNISFVPSWSEQFIKDAVSKHNLKLSAIKKVLAEKGEDTIEKAIEYQQKGADFERKAVLVDEAGEEFEDNDERAIFFARGVLETVKKLNWTPTVVHCLGWMSAITPIYLKKVFNDDPLFRDVKIVVTLCDDRFEKQLSDDFKDKIANEGVNDAKLENLSVPSYENLYRFVIDYADGVVISSEKADAALVEYARQSGKPVLEYSTPEGAEFFDNYNRFYEEL